ncbi:MAG: hypothetical protein FJ304_21460 [Planctomycetes bacterium]|nr:hypothetical protein [Planctomycetota bacterium]
MDRPDSIGARLDVFGPWRANLIAGYVLALLCAAGGAVLVVRALLQLPVLFNKPGPETRSAAGFTFLGVLPGLLLLGFAGLFAYLAHSFAARRFELYEHGFGYWDTSGGTVAFWPEVAGFEEEAYYDSELLRYRLFITLRDGRGFSFDRESVGRLGRLRKVLRAVATAHGIPYVTSGPA